MKTPLRYQATEYDCGPTALLNAVAYLYDVEEIPPDFPKNIYGYTLDECNEHGVACRRGTSTNSMFFMASWFNTYAQATKYPIETEFFRDQDVKLEQIENCLRQGGVSIVKCELDGPHYITVTGMDERYLYVFDPYYVDYEYGHGIITVYDHPKEYNRLIPKERWYKRFGFYTQTPENNRMVFNMYKTGKGEVLHP